MLDDGAAHLPPGTARSIASTLRRDDDLREHPVVLSDGEEARLTFSGGACRWTPGEDVRGLLSRADEALYRAKAEGGNTVVHLD